MRVLITGAFGNIGESALLELLPRGIDVVAFDLPTKHNRKVYRGLEHKSNLEVVWGNITNRELVSRTISDDLDCIIHLAALIPPVSEANPELAYEVNVGGTRNLLDGVSFSNSKPKFVYASSIATYGHSDGSGPPRSASDSQIATDNYTSHKIECEGLVKESGLPWTILQFGVVAPLMLGSDFGPILFDIPLEQRIEFVHTRDIGLAVANAVTAASEGKTLLVGGGEDCRMYYGEFAEALLEAMGVGMLPESAFKQPASSEDYFYTDWMDSQEAQEILQYQTRSFQQFLGDYRKLLGHGRYLVRLFRPVIRWRLLSQSPYYKK